MINLFWYEFRIIRNAKKAERLISSVFFTVVNETTFGRWNSFFAFIRKSLLEGEFLNYH